MKKYWTVFTLALQKQLEVRSDFLFERTRSFCVLVSLYFLWTALLSNQAGVLGYSRSEILTYVLLMTLLRAWVLGCVTDRIPMEIAKGELSDILLRPVSHSGYWASQDAANKCLNLGSAVVEITVFSLLVAPPVHIPSEPWTWLLFSLSVLGGMVLYFQMSYLLGVLGFWTAQSWGPRFCFEVVLEFCAGAYFPIDLLPAGAQKVLSALPFPHLVYYPASIYLGRLSAPDILFSFGMQLLWIIILTLAIKIFWGHGLRRYAAEGR